MSETSGNNTAHQEQMPAVPDEVVDQLLERANSEGADLLGPDGMLSAVTKQVLERALDVELSEHLGYDKHGPAGRGSGNSRNGATPKTVQTDIGPVDIAVPRDRAGSFEPQIVPKGTRRLSGFDERIIALYARGMSTRDIQAHLAEMYQVGHVLLCEWMGSGHARLHPHLVRPDSRRQRWAFPLPNGKGLLISLPAAGRAGQGFFSAAKRVYNGRWDENEGGHSPRTSDARRAPG